jgi:hypothetical protein
MSKDMPTHNYICGLGHAEMDVYYTGKPMKARECPECGEESTINFGSMGAFNRLMSSQGHNQAHPDPQTGLYYENATDRRRKLKDMGLEEGDMKTRSQIELETHEAQQRAKSQRATNKVLAADSEEEIMNSIDWDSVDRQQSGDLSRNVESGYGIDPTE